MSRFKYLIKNLFIFTLGSLGSRLVSFFLVPVYTAVLLPNEYGIIDLLYTLCTVIGPILILNMNEGLMRFCMDKNANRERILQNCCLTVLISSLLGLVIIPIINCFSVTSGYGVIVYLCSITIGLSYVFLFYLRGIEKPLLYSIGCIVQTFFVILFNVVFLVYLHWGIIGYFRAYILANIITVIYCLIVSHVKKPLSIYNSVHSIDSRNEIKALLMYSIALIPNTLMWWIMNASDRIMIIAMIGSAANGIYSVSYKIPGLVSICNTIFNQAWSYSAIKESESNDRIEFTNSIFEKLLSFVTIISILILIVLKPIMHIYVSESYFNAWYYSPILLLGNSFLILGSFVASATYIVEKNSIGMMKSGIAGAIPNIILNAILIPIIGNYGAAIATCFSYIVVLIYRLYDTKKTLPINMKNSNNLIAIVLLLVSTLTIYLPEPFGISFLLLEEVFAVVYFKKHFIEFFKRVFKRM